MTRETDEERDRRRSQRMRELLASAGVFVDDEEAAERVRPWSE